MTHKKENRGRRFKRESDNQKTISHGVDSTDKNGGNFYNETRKYGMKMSETRHERQVNHEWWKVINGV